MSKTTIVSPPGLPFVEIIREFDAPRELVYRAQMDPELLVQWLGPRRYAMRVEVMEARDGGRYRYLHYDAEGNEFWFRGVHHGTPSPDGITRTFEFEGVPGHVSLETLTLEEHGGKTVFHARAAFQSVEDRDAMVDSGMAEGVDEGMERLHELLAKLTPARR
ncbi:MAG TPA: SRPBCC family protein [Dehalococcoidia bacterium]